MVAQIHLALTERLERIAWMSRETKEKALDKLSRLRSRLGIRKCGAIIRDWRSRRANARQNA